MSNRIRICFQSLLESGIAECTQAEIEAALFVAIEERDSDSEFRCRLLRANHLLKERLIEAAEQDFRQAETLGTDLGHIEAYIDLVSYGLGSIRYSQGNVEQALDYLNAALQKARKIGRKSTEVSSLLTLSAVYTANGVIAEAIRYLRQASTLSKEANLHAQHLRSLLQLAELYLMRCDVGEALRVSGEAIEVADLIGEDIFVCRAKVRHATVLVEAGEAAKADALLDSVEVIIRSYSQSSLGGTFELTRAKIAVLQKDEPRAFHHFDAALLLFRTLGEPRLLVNSLALYAEYLINGGQHDPAILKLNEGLALATKHDDTQGIATCAQLLAKAHAASSNYEQAFSFSMQHHEAEKKLAADEADSQLRLLRIENESERREEEKERYRLKSELLEQELTTTTLHLLAQTELLSNFRDSLREIVRRIPPNEPAIRELKEKLKELPCKSVDWPKFEAQFASVHPEFKGKLVEKYPTLSPAEVRMCILIRLGLKSLEIARLTCLSERSVEDHRFHIRKKLRLKRNESVTRCLTMV